MLPATSGNRNEERRARKLLESRPRDPVLAVAVAKRYLAQAHELGDPRCAGLALAAIAGWTDDATTPDDLLMMKATLQQYLHEFDASVRTLELLLARPATPGRAQAWLTLATVRRVQGRYAESDRACGRVAHAGAALHSGACLAENAALRGETDVARRMLGTLLSQPGLPAATQAWLLTTVAELEQRDGRATAADAAFRAVLRLDPDPYARVDYADFLIEQHRPLEALDLLQGQTRTDVVLLRLAIAGAQARTPGAARDAAEMRERIALADERPEARTFHGREQAMFALQVERDPARALELARGDVLRQREPLDLLVLAQAARANGEPAAIAEARELRKSIGLHDRRLDALL
ncbi:MAG: hypothetical protein ABI156_08305 [Caldimonas sp.]